jgi:hypothetical protein
VEFKEIPEHLYMMTFKHDDSAGRPEKICLATVGFEPTIPPWDPIPTVARHIFQACPVWV